MHLCVFVRLILKLLTKSNLRMANIFLSKSSFLKINYYKLVLIYFSLFRPTARQRSFFFFFRPELSVPGPLGFLTYLELKIKQRIIIKYNIKQLEGVKLFWRKLGALGWPGPKRGALQAWPEIRACLRTYVTKNNNAIFRRKVATTLF